MHASLTALVAGLFLVSCGGQQAASQAPLAPRPVEPVSTAPGRDRAALSEAREFAEDVAQGKAEVSSEALLRRAFPDGLSKRDTQTLTSGLERVVTSLIARVGASVASGNSFDVTRVKDRKGERWVLTRLAGGGVDYYEWVLVEGPDGRQQVADIYLYTAGEFLSGIIRRVFIPVLALTSDFDTGTLSLADRQFLDLLPRMTSYKKLLESDPRQAFEKIKEFPVPLAETKFMILMKLRAASAWAGDLGNDPEADAAYFQVCEEFVARFPDDSAVDLIGLDAWIENKEFGKALHALDRLQKRVGEDGYLLWLRAVVQAEKGELSRAATHAYKARRLEPRMLEVRWTLFDILAKSKRFGAAVDELRSLRDELGVEEVYFDDELYKTAPEWGPFYESSQYRAFEAEGQAAALAAE